MASRAFSARFDLATVERLERRAKRTGVSKSQLAQLYIEEGLRMADHPGILFRDGVSGRRAALATGPDVWQVIWVLQSGEDRGEAAIAGTADWMALSVDQVRSAIRYYADFTDEVDERIRRNAEMADEAEERWRQERLVSA